jgi:5'(3')-deoxyribonucleotidase
MSKELLFFDMDGVLADFDGTLQEITNTNKDSPNWHEVADKACDTKGFFEHMKPIPGAIEAFKLLSEKYDCHILSTSPWDSDFSCSEKKKWVKKHLGELAYKKLTLTHHKELLSGRALIDDRTKNGAAEFQGEHIHFGTEKFPNWNSVIKYLI